MATVIPGVYPKPTVTGPNGQTVIGPKPSRIHSVARWLDASGKLLGDSGVVIDGGDNLTVPGRINGRVVQEDGANLDQLMPLVPRIPSQNEKNAMKGTTGTPSDANRFVTDSDPRLTGGGGGGINPPAGQIGGSTSHPTVLGIRETGGPTELTFSGIGDGTILKRSGSTIVGQSLPFANVGVLEVSTSTASIPTNKNRIFVTSLSADATLTLPAASAVADGWEIHVYDRTESAGNPYVIGIAPAGVDTINGSTASRYLKCPGDHLSVMQIGGAWYFTQWPTNVLNVETMGKLYGDGVHDDYAVIQAALDAGPNAAVDPSGFRVFLRRGTYRVSQTLKLRRCIIFEGEGSGSFNGFGTLIVPDKGCQGLVINGFFDSAIANTRADLCIVRNFAIKFPNSAQSATWQATHSYLLGELVTATTDNPSHHWVWEAVQAGTSDSSEPTWSSADPGFVVAIGGATRSGGNLVTVTTPAAHGWSTSNKIYVTSTDANFSSGVKTITVTDSTHFTYSEAGSNVSNTVQVTVTKTLADNTILWVARDINGIDMKVKSTIENVSITSSPGNGIHIQANAVGTPSTNCNEFVLRRVSVIGSKLNGFMIDGPDANAGYAEKCYASANGYWGFYDSSFLGNTHTGHDTDSNTLGGYHDDDPNAFNIWTGCYSEGGMPPSDFQAQRSIVIGGLHGAGITNNSAGMFYSVHQAIIESNQGMTFRRVNGIGSGSYFTASYSDGFPFSFGDSTIGWSVAVGGGTMGGTHEVLWRASNADAYMAMTFSGPDSALTGNTPGHIMFNNGYFLSGPGPVKPHYFATAVPPTTEAFSKQTGSVAWDAGAIEQSGYDSGVLGFKKVHQAIYSSGPDYWTMRLPHFGSGNTVDLTTTVGSPHQLNFLTEAGITFTNATAVAKVGVKLQQISGGAYTSRSTEFGFSVLNSVGMRLTAFNGNNKIKWGSTGGLVDYLESTTVGSWLKLKACFDITTGAPWAWIVTEAMGVWTDGTNTYYGLDYAGTNTFTSGIVVSNATNADAVAATATGTGTALKGTQTGSGYCLSLVGDTTSPVSPTSHMAPADAIPSGAAVVGDEFISTDGQRFICTTAGTPGVFQPTTWVPKTVTTDQSPTAFNSGTSYNNVGAGSDIVVNLPATPSAGQRYRATVGAAHYIKFLANTGQTIYVGDGVSASAGFVRCASIGCSLTLEALTSTIWVVTAITGPWTIDT